MSDIDISRNMVEHLCRIIHRGYEQYGTVTMLLALRAALDRAESDKAAAVEAERKRLRAFAINLKIDGEMSAKNPNIFGRRIADFGIGQVDSCDRFIAAIRQSGAA